MLSLVKIQHRYTLAFRIPLHEFLFHLLLKNNRLIVFQKGKTITITIVIKIEINLIQTLARSI
jgi:hypothetical protein